MKQLYFCRHGQSVLNADHIYTGQIDTDLSDLGYKQIELVAATATNFTFDLIITSPLFRAHETAKVIAKAIGYPEESIIVNDLFKERFLGSLEGKSSDVFPDDQSQFTDMETSEALLERAKAGLAFIESQAADTVLLVGHAAHAIALRLVINPAVITEELPNAQIVQLI